MNAANQPLAQAERFLREGRFVAAEIACRDLLDREPRDPAALNMLGAITASVGLNRHAEAFFREALTAAPQFEQARQNLAMLQARPAPSPPAATGPRYLLIKGWGYGFWSDVSHVLGALLLAEITGRIPVIHWGGISRFRDDSGREAFQHYYEPVSDVSLDDLIRLEPADFWPAKWNRGNLANDNVGKWQGPFARAGALYFIDRPERIAVSDFYIGVIDAMPWIPAGHPLHGKNLAELHRYLAGKYLRPRPAIAAQSEAFFQARLAGTPFVAAHLRGSDKLIEDAQLDRANQQYSTILRSFDPSWRILLLTDDARWLDRLTAEFGARIVATDCQRTASNTGLHYLSSSDRVRLGTEVMVDVDLALRADAFVGYGGSNVSGMIAMLKDWPQGACILSGVPLLARRNLMLYVSAQG